MNITAPADQAPDTSQSQRMQALFDLLAEDGKITVKAIEERITESGIGVDDFRLRATREKMAAIEDSVIDINDFVGLVSDELLILSRIFSAPARDSGLA
jgi:hypothetical protein